MRENFSENLKEARLSDVHLVPDKKITPGTAFKADAEGIAKETAIALF